MEGGQTIFSRKTKGAETIQLEVDGRIISDRSDVATVFNDYFLNVANTIGNSSQYSQNVDSHPSYRTIEDHVKENYIPVFEFNSISSDTVSDIIERLPSGKAPGYDNISGYCVKSAKNVICIPLQCLVNRMFVQSVFPDPLKHAVIIYYYKYRNPLLSMLISPLFTRKTTNCLPQTLGWSACLSVYLRCSNWPFRTNSTLNSTSFTIFSFRPIVNK